MKAFLGMGLLGSNFVKAMLKRGEAVQIWNRTPGKTAALEQAGAKSFLNVSDAVRGADRIHVTVKDDAAVDEVLAAAKPGLKNGAIIIDHSTTTMEGAIQRTKQWKESGFIYQHAPVFMGPANALEASGFMLVSGDQSVISTLEADLSKMTGKLINFGEEPGRAAAMKLTGNSFLVGFTAALADTIGLAKALKVPQSDMEKLFSQWNPASTLNGRLRRIASGDYSNPSWELTMARKDTKLFMTAAEHSNVSLNVIPSIATVMDHWIEKGHAHDDWTVIGKSFAF